MKKIAVIILNWNGWRDTCECIASIQMNRDLSYQLIIIDNGSEDDSLINIEAFLKGRFHVYAGPFDTHNKSYYIDSAKCISLQEFQNGTVLYEETTLLVASPENLGFAKACNEGISYAIRNSFEYIFLLNNDTTLKPDCIRTLTQFIEQHSSFHIVSPVIYYYDNPDRIWYFGGKLTYTGRRAIYYENRHRDHLKESFKEISFISGCALFAKTEIFIKYGLLSERFYFGEEDYEYSWRMKENNVKMFAISNAKVYHKVSVSNKKMFSESRLPYILIGYLNRFIDRKIHTQSMIYFNIWRFTCCLYIIPKLILVNRYSVVKIIKLLYWLITYSTLYDVVDKKIFFNIQKQWNV